MSCYKELRQLLAQDESCNGEDHNAPQLRSSTGVGWIHLSFPFIDFISLSIGGILYPAMDICRRTSGLTNRV